MVPGQPNAMQAHMGGVNTYGGGGVTEVRRGG